MGTISSTAVSSKDRRRLLEISTATDTCAASYYFSSALSDWSMPTWKFIFSAGSQLHGADGPFLFGPAESMTPGQRNIDHSEVDSQSQMRTTPRSLQC